MVPFAKNSLHNGLEIIVDSETYDYSVSSTSSEGLVLSLMHHVSQQKVS